MKFYSLQSDNIWLYFFPMQQNISRPYILHVPVLVKNEWYGRGHGHYPPTHTVYYLCEAIQWTDSTKSRRHKLIKVMIASYNCYKVINETSSTVSITGRRLTTILAVNNRRTCSEIGKPPRPAVCQTGQICCSSSTRNRMLVSERNNTSAIVFSSR